jgi:uncharacterized integral membrane protein (TIGR00697 family)
MPQTQQQKEFRYLEIITGLIVAVLLISNVASVKILVLGWFIFDGGTILFPLSYIFGDVLTEVYGYARSRRVIWTGFASAALMSLIFLAVGALPPAPEWKNQEAYMTILGFVPRIVVGSLIAYFAGEFSNSYVLARMKIWTQGRWLFTRTIGSTIVGEGVDTAIFATIAFYGTMSGGQLGALIISNYIFKVGFETVATPATYAIVGFLKRREHEDYYDYRTNFNPFFLRTS